jgi:hypothetical protein
MKRLALSASDDKALLLEMAKTWRRLAERAGKAEGDTGE